MKIFDEFGMTKLKPISTPFALYYVWMMKNRLRQLRNIIIRMQFHIQELFIGFAMYAMACILPNIVYAISVVSK